MSGHEVFSTQERHVTAALSFASGGDRTFLSRQRVPYPFHITRPFYLDAERPDLATLYLQSASGGIYRGDRLTLDIEARAGAAAHITTQASSVVHDTGAVPAQQSVVLDLAATSIFALTADPVILFPGAALTSATTITMEDGARAILTDGFSHHDPRGAETPFTDMTLSLTIRDRASRIRVRERGRIAGQDFLGDASPMGGYRAYGSLLILAPRALWPDALALQAAFDACGCLAGTSPLPNEAGLQLRALALDSGALRSGLDAGFALAFEALVGIKPARRRK